jgi:hypothetical protein
MFKIALRVVGAKISELFGPEIIFGWPVAGPFNLFSAIAYFY